MRKPKELELASLVATWDTNEYKEASNDNSPNVTPEFIQKLGLDLIQQYLKARLFAAETSANNTSRLQNIARLNAANGTIQKVFMAQLISITDEELHQPAYSMAMVEVISVLDPNYQSLINLIKASIDLKNIAGLRNFSRIASAIIKYVNIPARIKTDLFDTVFNFLDTVEDSTLLFHLYDQLLPAITTYCTYNPQQNSRLKSQILYDLLLLPRNHQHRIPLLSTIKGEELTSILEKNPQIIGNTTKNSSPEHLQHMFPSLGRNDIRKEIYVLLQAPTTNPQTSFAVMQRILNLYQYAFLPMERSFSARDNDTEYLEVAEILELLTPLMDILIDHLKATQSKEKLEDLVNSAFVSKLMYIHRQVTQLQEGDEQLLQQTKTIYQILFSAQSGLPTTHCANLILDFSQSNTFICEASDYANLLLANIAHFRSDIFLHKTPEGSLVWLELLQFIYDFNAENYINKVLKIVYANNAKQLIADALRYQIPKEIFARIESFLQQLSPDEFEQSNWELDSKNQFNVMLAELHEIILSQEHSPAHEFMAKFVRMSQFSPDAARWLPEQEQAMLVKIFKWILMNKAISTEYKVEVANYIIDINLTEIFSNYDIVTILKMIDKDKLIKFDFLVDYLIYDAPLSLLQKGIQLGWLDSQLYTKVIERIMFCEIDITAAFQLGKNESQPSPFLAILYRVIKDSYMQAAPDISIISLVKENRSVYSLLIETYPDMEFILNEISNSKQLTQMRLFSSLEPSSARPLYSSGPNNN